MRVYEFAKAAGVPSETVIAALNSIRASTDVKAQTNITDEEQGVLIEKFPAVSPDAVKEEVAPVVEVVTKPWNVYAVGQPVMVIEAEDESEAVRKYILAREIKDPSVFNFRTSPAEAVEV